MKMNRALSLALAGALGLSMLAGCGGGSANTPAPAESGAPESGSPAGAILIGGIGPLTGSNAVYGQATKQGAEIAIQEINALGGLQLALDSQDDEGDTEKSLNAYNTDVYKRQRRGRHQRLGQGLQQGRC